MLLYLALRRIESERMASDARCGPVWDRRIIVSNSYKWRNFAGRIFISPDEPLEERRIRTFDRIKYRAERAGKGVVVNGDILSIDGVMVFSLENGNLIQYG